MADDDNTPDGATSDAGGAADEPSYEFDGLEVQFAVKLALTPVQLAGSNG